MSANENTQVISDGEILADAPYFSPSALRDELTALNRELSSKPPELRRAVLARLKALKTAAHQTAEQQLMNDGLGNKCARSLSVFQDELIRLIYDFTVSHIYRAQNPSDAERLSLVATGGYGRAMLAPGSDIDLLFLLPYKQTPWGESVIEYMLYLLWDLGLKVGHATRSVEQCIKLSLTDMTIRTALLDARPIHGDEQLFDELAENFHNAIIGIDRRGFIDAKLVEREDRISKVGQSRYVVEPNIKDGKGGLRDLHTLHWLMKYLHDAAPGREAVNQGIFSAEEFHSYRKCEDFLWTVRCHLHFLAKRAEERLSFDMQPMLAERLGYTQHAGLRSVERFMRHYFLTAKEVGDLTRVVCAELELKQLKSLPILDHLLAPMTWRQRIRIKRRTDFKVENGRLNVEDDDVFDRNPVNILRLFKVAENHSLAFHPNALRLVRRSLRRINKKLRKDKRANAIFLDLLTSEASSERVLRRMNEVGVLGRFVPEFGRIISMMQFNMYHHYTVDEHLIRAVGVLSEIDRGELVDGLPLASGIIKQVTYRRALYVAVFLHDIAKGRDESHSIAGARVARALCPRFGLTSDETDTVAWLIEQHLTMSQFAQSRDLNDPKTIADFAAIVQSPERLRLLLILTVADIRAVGPGVWNGWKGQLLRSLYYETELMLAGGHSVLGHRERVGEAQQALREALGDWPGEALQNVMNKHYPAYWLRTDGKTLIRHARLIRDADESGTNLATLFATDEFTAVTELTVLTPDHPKLLSMMAGACSVAGANIVGAQINTTRDGSALDTFLLQREFDRDQDEERRVRRITGTIEKLLRGETYPDQLKLKQNPSPTRLKAFKVEPVAVLDNSLSDAFTVIEVNGLDRPGLLHDLTATLSALNLEINSAHITTYGEKVVDVFYVTDLLGKKITDPSRRKTISSDLISVLSGKGALQNRRNGKS